MKIVRAEKKDLNEILLLQYAAFQSEAKILNNEKIPPLTQTLSDLQEEFDKKSFLKATDENEKILGSVRFFLENETVYIGKLIVNPKFQNHGIGAKLLLEVEKIFPGKRYELFTRAGNFKNLAFYKKYGYKIFSEEIISDNFKFVYLEKI